MFFGVRTQIQSRKHVADVGWGEGDTQHQLSNPASNKDCHFLFFLNSKVGTFWIYGGKQFTAPSDKLRGFFMCLS